MFTSRTLRTVGAAAAVVTLLAGCSIFDSSYPDKQAGKTQPTASDDSEGFFIPLPSLFGGDSKKSASPAPIVGFGVNGYLWRASLDTLAFLPLSSADPYGGIIITEWYAPPETPNDRFKATITITDRELRADGVHVALFRQTRITTGGWSDAPVSAKTRTDVENAILTRARELRSAAAVLKKD